MMRTQHMAWLRLCLVLATLACAIGCWPEGARYPKYDNRLWNASSSDLRDVTISWQANGQEFSQGHTGMGPNHGGDLGVSYGFSPDPIPEKVLAHWITEEGVVHNATVEVGGRFPISNVLVVRLSTSFTTIM